MDGPVHALQTPDVGQTPAADAEDVFMTILPFVHMQKHENWSNTFSSDGKLFSVKDDVPFSVFFWG